MRTIPSGAASVFGAAEEATAAVVASVLLAEGNDMAAVDADAAGGASSPLALGCAVGTELSLGELQPEAASMIAATRARLYGESIARDYACRAFGWLLCLLGAFSFTRRAVVAHASVLMASCIPRPGPIIVGLGALVAIFGIACASTHGGTDPTTTVTPPPPDSAAGQDTASAGSVPLIDHELTPDDCAVIGEKYRALLITDGETRLQPGLRQEQRDAGEQAIKEAADKLSTRWTKSCQNDLVGKVAPEESLKCAMHAKTVAAFDSCLNAPTTRKN
jgi:hypothetical protein